MQVGGNLKYFQANWHLITDDPWVLETIVDYKIEFYFVPHQVVWLYTSMSTALQEAIQAKIDKMALLDAIHPVFCNTQVRGGGVGGGGGVRSIFLVDLLRKTAAPPGYKPKQSEFLFAFSAFRHGKWSNWT